MIGPVYLTRASECLFSLAGLLRMGTPHGHQAQWTQLSLPGYDTRDQTHGTREPGKYLYAVFMKKKPTCNQYFKARIGNHLLSFMTMSIGMGDNVCPVIIA